MFLILCQVLLFNKEMIVCMDFRSEELIYIVSVESKIVK